MDPQTWRYIGPCGGWGGETWRYTPEGPITQIAVKVGVHGAIRSIKFTSSDPDSPVISPLYGGNHVGASEEKIHTVIIDVSEEYLISVKGTFDKVDTVNSTIIKSLQFHTNLRTYGPFGSTEGTKFSLSGKNSKIVGFYGQADEYLDSIGILVQSLLTEPIALGPCGGAGGENWSHKRGPIIHITVEVFASLNIILKFKHRNFDGSTEEFQVASGVTKKPKETHNIDINAPTEYLTCINGTVGSDNRGTTVVTSIRFITNLQNHGPFGSQSGSNFSLQMEGSAIVGFHGRAGNYLDCIGIYAQP